MTGGVADLMRRNLLNVFNEHDPDRRAVALAELYADDVVWHAPDRVVRGRKTLESRDLVIQGQHATMILTSGARPCH